ncbi:MAG: peptidylprolyl isomerase [Flavobacteriales bacterium]
MYKFALAFFILILSACNSVSDKTIEQITTKIDSAKKVTTTQPIIEVVPELITDENVTEKLLVYGKENPETIIEIYTTKGQLKVRLFEDTPLHRANFVMMAKKGFFEGSVFTRVVKDFMAQGGGTYNDKQVEVKKQIGHYTVPNEISKNRFHKKGALGAARSYLSNPDKRSDPYAFYLVEGTTYTEAALDHYEYENKYKFTQTQRDYYKTNKGAAHIDGEHTVFGEIIEGFNVVPKLTNVRTDSRDWPHDDILIEKVVVIK